MSREIINYRKKETRKQRCVIDILGENCHFHIVTIIHTFTRSVETAAYWDALWNWNILSKAKAWYTVRPDQAYFTESNIFAAYVKTVY